MFITYSIPEDSEVEDKKSVLHEESVPTYFIFSLK